MKKRSVIPEYDPTCDRNNVAYYKKTPSTTSSGWIEVKRKKEITPTATDTSTKVTTTSKSMPTWTQVVSSSKNQSVRCVEKNQGGRECPSSHKKLKRSNIQPAFVESETNTRVVVKVTHFNNKKFNGFVTFEDAKYQIFQAIGLELSSHHGTTFMRSEEDDMNNPELFITFKLKQPVQKDQLHRYFWYLKESDAGFDDKISGEVIFPRLDINIYSDTGSDLSVPRVNRCNSVKQVKIEGCHYKLSEAQIRWW